MRSLALVLCLVGVARADLAAPTRGPELPRNLRPEGPMMRSGPTSSFYALGRRDPAGIVRVSDESSDTVWLGSRIRVYRSHGSRLRFVAAYDEHGRRAWVVVAPDVRIIEDGC